MQAIIPDTLQGALILSVIDFFLSFIIISGIGVVLAFFPLFNRIGAARLGGKRKAKAEVALQTPLDAETGHHIAVIAAAVYATVGGAYRIVHIESARPHDEWRAEGRIAHHISHAPRPRHR